MINNGTEAKKTSDTQVETQTEGERQMDKRGYESKPTPTMTNNKDKN